MELNEWCPLSGMTKHCYTDCAWFVEGGCAMVMLNYIDNKLDLVQDAVNTLNETIEKIDFSS